MADPIRNILEKQFDGATRVLNEKLKSIEKLEAKNKELKAKLAKAVEALRFYDEISTDIFDYISLEFDNDGFCNKARKTLEEIEKGE